LVRPGGTHLSFRKMPVTYDCVLRLLRRNAAIGARDELGHGRPRRRWHGTRSRMLHIAEARPLPPHRRAITCTRPAADDVTIPAHFVTALLTNPDGVALMAGICCAPGCAGSRSGMEVLLTRAHSTLPHSSGVSTATRLQRDRSRKSSSLNRERRPSGVAHHLVR